MKFLFVSLNFSPELTATGKYTGEMASWMASKGHKVDVIAAPPHYPRWVVEENYQGLGFYRETLDGVTVLRTPCYIPSPEKVTSLRRILMELNFTLASLYWWIPIFFRRKEYDVVVAVCPPLQNGIFPYLYKLFRGVPYGIHVQDFQVDMAVELGMLKRGVLTRCLFAIERFLLKNADFPSSISPAMCKRATDKQANQDRLFLLPNWSNTDFVKPGPSSNSFRRNHGIPDDAFLVLYAGVMGVKQGLEIILDVAEQFQERPDVLFYLVGNGGSRSSLEHRVAEKELRNVRFLDVQPYEDLPDMLTAADVHLVVQKAGASDLVLPSKLTNIFSAGKPCIATATTDSTIASVITGYSLGLVVEPESPALLREAIWRLYEKPAMRDQFAKNARDYAEKYLDIDAILSGYMEHLSSRLHPAVSNNTPTRSKSKG